MKRVITLIALCIAVGFAKDAEETISLYKQSARTAPFFDNAYAFAVIPKVTKAGLLLGHAGGKGTLFVKGESQGAIKTSFHVIGPVIGVEQYSQIVFFEDQKSVDRYLKSEERFSKEEIAEPLLSAERLEADYTNGVAVFTSHSKGLGLFYTPSLRGQKLKKVS